MSRNLESLAEQSLAAAMSAGADAADVLALDADGISMEMRAGALEHAERAEGVEIGLRVLIGQRQSCVSISDTRADAINMMAERAVAMAKEAPDDPYCGLASPEQLARDWDLDVLDLVDSAEMPASDALAKSAARAEEAALAVKGISQVSGVSADASQTRIFSAATNGFSAGYQRSSYGLSCVAITGEGLAMERDYAYDSRIYQSDLQTPEEIGALAAERTLERAGARQPKTGAFPVLFDERISSSLIGHLTAAINGQSIARGNSWLMDALGEVVLPAALSLTSDPTRARVAGSRPFDAEGLAVAPRDIIRDGVLTGWTLDLANARKLNMQSTGDARRNTSAVPAPALGNLTLTPGDQSRADMISAMGEGLLVTSLMGSTVNPNTGDYSRGASGFWVRNGQISEPVNECTIAGNLREMLAGIIPANDGRAHLSRVIPSLLVEGLTIAGG